MNRASSQRAQGSRILGTGHYVPARVMTNQELEQLVETSNAWIVERTGIEQRHIAAEGELTSDMASQAARRALEAAEIDAKDIDLIIVGTVTPDHPLPSTAVYVQQKIGARSDCPSFDLSAACAGFIYGLSIADQYIRTGVARYVLVIGAELLSRIVDWSDRSTCVLFGDGAGAVVVGPSQSAEQGILSTHLYADGSLAPALCVPAGGAREPASHESVEARRHFVHMAGKDIFKFAVRALAAASRKAIESGELSPEDIDWVVAHQANSRILEAVSCRVNIPMERFILNIHRYGNTSSASVPIALDEGVRSGAIRSGQNIVLCALGGGIAWGSALIRW